MVEREAIPKAAMRSEELSLAAGNVVKWQMGSSSCLFGFHQQKMLLRQAELFTLLEQCWQTFKTFSILNNGHVWIKSSFNSSRSIRLKTSKPSQIGNQSFVQRKTFALGPRAIKICKWSIHGFGLEIGTLPLTNPKVFTQATSSSRTQEGTRSMIPLARH